MAYLEEFEQDIKEIKHLLEQILYSLNLDNSLAKNQSTAKIGGSFTKKELAEYLGISEQHIFNMYQQGIIPYRKIGRRVIFPKVLIDKWLAEEGRL